MKIIASLTFASVLMVSACSDSPQEQEDAQMPAMASSTSSERSYRCESGEEIAASYPTSDSATVQYKGRSYSMKIAVSGSGARYVGNELEWWTKESEGTLLRRNANGTSGDRIEVCEEF